MERECEGFRKHRLEILTDLLKIFLIDLSRQCEGAEDVSPNSRRKDLASSFFRLLDQKYMQNKMVSHYADELMVTPNYLNEIVKSTTGQPASYHIQQRIALEAKRLARYAGKSMKEVAFSLGFEDVAHFSKFFKRTVGVNFTEFKRIGTSQLVQLRSVRSDSSG